MTLGGSRGMQGSPGSRSNRNLHKDAHESGRNMDISLLPKGKNHIGLEILPDSMVCGLDQALTPSCSVGYHSPAGTSGKPWPTP